MPGADSYAVEPQCKLPLSLGEEVVSTGRCCCGATSVEVSGEPTLVATCHCDDCRRRTGSAFGWSAYFPDERVVGPDGTLSEYRPAVDDPQMRWFCRNCGTTIAWRTGRFPGQVGVAAGAFVEDPLPSPSIVNRSSACVEWLTLPADWRHIA